MATNILPQALFQGQKIDKLKFYTCTGGSDVHSFYNSGYNVVVVKAAAPSVLTFQDRKSSLTGTAEVKVVNAGAQAGGTSITFGYLSRQTNEIGTALAKFTCDVTCEIAVVQIMDPTFLCEEFININNLLNNLTPETNGTANLLEAAESESVLVDGSTVIVGAYRAAGGLTITGQEGAADTGAAAVIDLTSGTYENEPYTPAAADMFMAFPSSEGFNGSATVAAVGDLTFAAVSLKSGAIVANS